MISLHTTEALITSVLLFFAYAFSITISGNFQAYVAKWMGDDTADSLGYTEFNPFIFIGPISIIWFVLASIMIGKPIPIELGNIKRSWWHLRAFFAFGARSISNIVLATLFSVVALMLCGPVSQIATTGNLSIFKPLAMINPEASTLKLILCIFCGAMAFANILLASINSLIQAIYFFVMYKIGKDFAFVEHAYFMLAFGPLVIFFFFGHIIINFFFYFVGCLVLGITKVCGVV